MSTHNIGFYEDLTTKLSSNTHLISSSAVRPDDEMSLIKRKPNFDVSDQVWHKPGCTTAEDGQRLELSDLGSRGPLLSL